MRPPAPRPLSSWQGGGQGAARGASAGGEAWSPCGPSERPFCLGCSPHGRPSLAGGGGPAASARHAQLLSEGRRPPAPATPAPKPQAVCGTSPGPGSVLSCLCGVWPISHLLCLGFPCVTRSVCIWFGDRMGRSPVTLGGTAQSRTSDTRQGRWLPTRFTPNVAFVPGFRTAVAVPPGEWPTGHVCDCVL